MKANHLHMNHGINQKFQQQRDIELEAATIGSQMQHKYGQLHNIRMSHIATKGERTFWLFFKMFRHISIRLHHILSSVGRLLNVDNRIYVTFIFYSL